MFVIERRCRSLDVYIACVWVYGRLRVCVFECVCISMMFVYVCVCVYLLVCSNEQFMMGACGSELNILNIKYAFHFIGIIF